MGILIKLQSEVPSVLGKTCVPFLWGKVNLSPMYQLKSPGFGSHMRLKENLNIKVVSYAHESWLWNMMV